MKPKLIKQQLHRTKFIFLLILPKQNTHTELQTIKYTHMWVLPETIIKLIFALI